MEEGEARMRRQLVVLDTNAWGLMLLFPNNLMYLKGCCKATEGHANTIHTLWLPSKALHDWAPLCLRSHISAHSLLACTLCSPQRTAGSPLDGLPLCLGSTLFHSSLPNQVSSSGSLPRTPRWAKCPLAVLPQCPMDISSHPSPYYLEIISPSLYLSLETCSVQSH